MTTTKPQPDCLCGALHAVFVPFTILIGLFLHRWCAVETLHTRRHTTASDVWSYGVLLWEIFSKGAMPYLAWSNARVSKEIALGNRLTQPVGCPFAVYELMVFMWHPTPEERPTFPMIQARLQLIDKTKAFRTKMTAPPNLTLHNAYATVPHTPQTQAWLKLIKATVVEKFAKGEAAVPEDSHYTQRKGSATSNDLPQRLPSVTESECAPFRKESSVSSTASSLLAQMVQSPQFARRSAVVSSTQSVMPLQRIISKQVLDVTPASMQPYPLLGSSDAITPASWSGALNMGKYVDPAWVYPEITPQEAKQHLHGQVTEAYLIARADARRQCYIIHLLFNGRNYAVPLRRTMNGWYSRDVYVAATAISLQGVLAELVEGKSAVQLPIRGGIVTPAVVA